MSNGESIPDIAEPSCQIFLKAHQVFLAFNEVVPDAHQTFCFASLADSILHEVGHHGKDDSVALQVDDLALVKQFLVEERPVLVGHSSGIVEVALQLAALNMNLCCGIVCEILIGIVELIEDIDGTWRTQQDCVQTCMQSRSRACLMVARAIAIHHDFGLQSAVGTGFLVEIDVDDVARLTNDSSRTREFAKGVAHAGILVSCHCLEMTIDIIIVANAEELLEALSGIARRRGKALPSIVLDLEHHSLHIVVQSGKVCILCKVFVVKSLNLVLENGAGIILEKVCKGGFVRIYVPLQFVIGIQFCPTFLDESVVQLYLFEAPNTIVVIAVPTYHNIACVAMQTYITGVEDIVGYVRSVVGSLNVESVCPGKIRGILRAEGTVLLDNVSLRAKVLQAPATARLHKRPVLRKLCRILALTSEHIGSEVLVDVVRIAHVLDAIVLARHRFRQTAQFEHSGLHLLQGVVLCNCYGPVATRIALAAPFIERCAVVSEVQTGLAREVAFGRDIDVRAARSVVWTELDVELLCACRGRAIVVVVTEETARIGIPQSIAVARFRKEPDLSKRIVVLGCAHSVCAVIGKANTGISAACEANDICSAENVIHISRS